MNAPRSARRHALWLAALAVAGALVGCVHYKPQPLRPAETAAALEARSLDAPGLKVFFQANLHSDPVAWNFEALTLAALYWHPSLDVARAEWVSTRSGEATAAITSELQRNDRIVIEFGEMPPLIADAALCLSASE